MLSTMEAKKMLPNIRTIATVLRGCMRNASADIAEQVWARAAVLKLSPDASALEYMIKTLASEHRIDRAWEMAHSAEGGETDAADASASDQASDDDDDDAEEGASKKAPKKSSPARMTAPAWAALALASALAGRKTGESSGRSVCVTLSLFFVMPGGCCFCFFPLRLFATSSIGSLSRSLCRGPHRHQARATGDVAADPASRPRRNAPSELAGPLQSPA